MKSATILGCGVAGSWIAHLLAVSGYDRFILFDGSDNLKSVLSLGPYANNEQKAKTASEQLAHHLVSIYPSIETKAHGHFCPKRDLDAVEGVVVGGMGAIADAKGIIHPNCSANMTAVTGKGHQWITLGIPSTKTGVFAIGTDPTLLTDDHFGEPNAAKEKILLAAAKAIQFID